MPRNLPEPISKPLFLWLKIPSTGTKVYETTNSGTHFFPLDSFKRTLRSTLTCLLIAIFSLVLAWGVQNSIAGADEHELVVERSNQISVSSIGFQPVGEKKATIIGRCSEFQVQDVVTGKTVLRKAVQPHPSQLNFGTADFSGLTMKGRYRLLADGIEPSSEFEVANNVFNRPFYVCFRAMYLWRCGMAVHAQHDGHEFRHGACHLVEGSHLYSKLGIEGSRDGTGGWHDAGDYNRYVGNGSFTAGMMLTAWDHFEPSLKGLDLDIPESNNNIPDFLDEIRWELEWLLKMQVPDGRVCHKLSTLKFGPPMLPEEDGDVQHFSPWGTGVTADFVAVMAHAARVYRKYDSAFSEKCLEAARRGYAVLEQYEEVEPDLTKFSTGTYDSTDEDDRLWAAAQLWETTGDAKVLQNLQTQIGKHYVIQGPSPSMIESDWDWQRVGNLGLFTYLLSKRPGRDSRLVARLTEDAIASADKIAGISARHPYGRPLGQRYFWGCNGTVARLAINLEVANRLMPQPKYRQAQLNAISYLFGRNDYGRSFVTGVGHRPPMFPHDRRSTGDDVVPPWPGYLVGGPWPEPTDWRDDKEDYKTNEVAINWNGALIYALAAFIEPATFATDTEEFRPGAK